MPVNRHCEANYTINVLTGGLQVGARHRARRTPPAIAATGRAMIHQVVGPRQPPYQKPEGVDVTDEILVGVAEAGSDEIFDHLKQGTRCQLVPDAEPDRHYYAVFVVRPSGDRRLFQKVSGNRFPLTFAVMKQGGRG